MNTSKINLEKRNDNSVKKVEFQERMNCICCNSSKLHPVWQGKFIDDPTRSFIQKCHYSKNVIALLDKETFSLVGCETCGTVFHQRILTPEWLNILYSQWINSAQIEQMEAECYTDSKQKILFELGRQHTKHILRLQKLLSASTTQPFRILDYGCGDGYFLSLAKLFGFDVYGIDFSSTRNERAATMGITIFNNLEALLAGLECSEFSQMHVVTLFQVLEHLEEPLKVLREIANIMSDSGILIVEVPDCQGISQPVNFQEFSAVHPLEHINAFTPITLKQICEQAGFVPIKRIPAHITTSFKDIVLTEASRFIQPNRTLQYYRLFKNR